MRQLQSTSLTGVMVVLQKRKHESKKETFFYDDTLH